MKMSVGLDIEKMVFDQNDNVNMMVSLAAPDGDNAKKRNPICVCALLDRSGSMSEQGGAMGSKMDYVKKSVWKMIDHMTDADSLALVFFDNQMESVEFKKMTSANKETMKQKVAGIHPRGSTDIGTALLTAKRMFASYEGGASAIERIMLLTDGRANQGAVEIEEFLPIAQQIRKGVTLSCFGYGAGFHEALLASLAKTGSGNNYFIESPDNVAKVFAVELGGLLTCYAQEIMLTVKAHKGTTVSNVLNDLDVETSQDPDGELVTKIKVGDIYAGEKRDILVRLAVEKRGQALPRPVTLVDVNLSYRTISDAVIKTDSAKAKVSLVKTASEASKERDTKIAEQVAILEAANAMVTAKSMADQGDWMGARNFIVASSTRLKHVGTDDAIKYAEAMDTMASSLNMSYTSDSMLSKSMGSVAYAASTSRFCRSVGTSSLGLDMGSQNNVTVDLLKDFTQDQVPDSQAVPSNEENAGGDQIVSSTAGTTCFKKTRRSS